MSTPVIYSGQGPVYMGDYDPVRGRPETGYLVNLKKIGCANRTLKTTFKQDSKVIQETDSGQRMTLKKMRKGKTATVELQMLQFDRSMLANSLYGKTALVAAGSVTGEELPNCAVGDFLFLAHPALEIDPAALPTPKELVITDSTGTPVELTEGTHYRVDSAAHSRLEVLSLTTVTQPLFAAYHHKAHGNIAMFAQSSVTKGIIFSVINTNDNNAAGRLIIPQIDFDPTSGFDWMSDDEVPITLSGEALYTPELAAAAPDDFGPFMKLDGVFAD